MPSNPEPPINIRTPGLIEALGDVHRLQLWEILRRQAAPIPVAQLAKAARMKPTAAQQALDLFAAVGLARSHPADSRFTAIRWSASRQTIVVRVVAHDPIDSALMARLDTILGKNRLKEIEAVVKPKAERVTGDQDFNGMHAATLDAAELAELWDMLLEIERFFHRCNNKFKNSGPDTNHDCNYHFGVQLAPLRPGVLPLPTLGFIAGHAVEKFVDKLSVEVSTLLTARELEVARALVAGKTSREVAERQRVSPHTVVEYTRRIYRKLGVKSRAQLAVRLAKA